MVKSEFQRRDFLLEYRGNTLDKEMASVYGDSDDKPWGPGSYQYYYHVIDTHIDSDEPWGPGSYQYFYHQIDRKQVNMGT